MTDKKVNLIITLKENVTAGMEKMAKSTTSLKTAFKALAATAATYLTFSAVVSGIRKAVDAFTEADKVAHRLKNTFTALGENGTEAVAVWKEYASAMMKITTLDDEAVLGLVNTAKMMGVTNDKIRFATEGAIGLAKAFDMDLNTAMKMTVLAMESEYSMLSRHIPALKSATTEAEKAAIVQRAMAAGFAIATKEGETLAGAQAELKRSFGEAMETIGEGIAGKGGVIGKVRSLKEAIDELAANGALTEFGENSGRVIDGIALAARNAVTSFTWLGQGLKAGASFIGTLGANIRNPNKEDGSMFDIIGRSLQETRNGLTPLVGSEEAKIAAIEKETVLIKEKAAASRKQRDEEAAGEALKNNLLQKAAREKDLAVAKEKADKKALAEQEIMYAIEIRKMEADGNEKGIQALERRRELIKATSEEQRNALRELYAMEDANAAEKKVTGGGKKENRFSILGDEGFHLPEFSLTPSEPMAALGGRTPYESKLFTEPLFPLSGSGGSGGLNRLQLEQGLANSLGESSPVGAGSIETKDLTAQILDILTKSNVLHTNHLKLAEERLGGVL